MHSEKKYLTEKKCPICGKNFIPAPQHAWGYKENGDFKKVCSYTCHRVAEKAKENKRKRNNKAVS
jgi:hypothetical protein